MSPILSSLEMIREAAAEWLRGLGDFSGVEILTRQKGDPVSRAREVLGKSGAVIIIDVPSAVPKAIQAMDVLLDPVHVLVECSENVPVNQDLANGGTGKSALYLAERVVAAFQLWKPPLDGQLSMSTFTPAAPGIEPMPAVREYPNLYIVQAHVTTRCGIPARQS